jgi:hypothetical protein
MLYLHVPLAFDKAHYIQPEFRVTRILHRIGRDREVGSAAFNLTLNPSNAKFH